MSRQIRWRIAIPFVALISLILLGLGIYLTNSIRQTKLQEFEDHLSMKSGQTNQIFMNPKEKVTEDYITGRFG